MEDLKGWKNTQWGMSEDEILISIGPGNIQRTDRQDYKKLYSVLEIRNVEIGKFPFKVVFQMGNIDHKLHQILIQHVNDEHQDPQHAFDVAKEILTERFGHSSRVGTKDEWEWCFPTTTVNISKTFIENILSIVSIKFFPASKRISSDISAF